MRYGTITKPRGRSGMSRSATALAAMLCAATLCGLAGTRPAIAQATYYADLDAAVAGLTRRLTEDARLEGRPVLVNAHDFFEEGTGRNLPLSKSLRERFGTGPRDWIHHRRPTCLARKPVPSVPGVEPARPECRTRTEHGRDASWREPAMRRFAERRL